MLTMRDSSVHQTSPSAEQSFRRLRQANILVLGLLGVLVVLGIWNVLTMASIVRGGVPDLADVSSIRGHISSRLITWISLITLAIFVFKEWKWGERGIGMTLFLAPLLFLWLVPVMSAEVEPTEEPMELGFTFSLCESGGIEGGRLLDASKCDVVPLQEGDIFMSASNPMEGDPQPQSPDTLRPQLAEWSIIGRGKFIVYFMVPQDSMEICESSRFTTSLRADQQIGHYCLEHGGEVWSVHPLLTSAVDVQWMGVYQEVEP